ncbi:MAG: LamG domain-containing protein, partial [Verrucomicrobiaceae bacterium]
MENPPSVARALAVMAHCALVPALMSPAHAELTNRWSFNQTAGVAPAGTVVADRVGTANAAVVGNGATFNGASLTLPGTTTGNQNPASISAYVDLPNGLISAKTDVTVEIWATPVSIKNWQRLFDFGRMLSSNTALSNAARGSGALAGEILPNATAAPNNATSRDDFAMATHRDSTVNTQRIMMKQGFNAEMGTNTGLALTVGTQHHIVCVFKDGVGSYGSEGGQMIWYLNGAQAGTLDVNFKPGSLSDRNNWLGRSMYSADNNANIAYNEVRIYSHALTPAEITANILAGPEEIGEPDPVDPPVPDNLWKFTTQADSEADAGTTFTDSIGSRVVTLRGNGGSLTGGAVVLPGSTTGNQPSSTISAYLDLPNGIVTSTPSVSFEAWAAPLSSKNWQRLFDFGRCATSHGAGAAAGEILNTNVAPGVTTAYDNLSLTFNNAGN